MVIGGIAAILHGIPRTTLDIDLFIEATLPNARRMIKAFQRTGLGTARLTTPEKILKHEITVCQDILRVDIFTQVKGIKFASVWPRRTTRRIGGVSIKVLGLKDLIRAKRAAGRAIDRHDISFLTKLLK